jgi:ubiquinone/menaquinone biosynthesis C-methylase UbiE
MSGRQLLNRQMVAAAAQCGFDCPRGFSGAVIGHVMAWTHGWRYNWVLSLLDVRPDDRVLEIGFGPGAAIGKVARLAERGLVAGIDPSEVMLRQASARHRHPIREGRVELNLAAMSAIPYGDCFFDKVFGVNSIQFSRDLPHDLGEIRRVLRPEGLALLAVQPLWKGADDATALEIGRDLRAAMAEAGFVRCSTEQKRIWPRMIVCAAGHSP